MDEPAAEDPQIADGPQLSDGLEHLQSAAKELVAAARSFLDVVEKVVDDDDRFSGAAATMVDLVGMSLGSASRDLAGGLLGGLAGREPAWLRNDPDHPDAAVHETASAVGESDDIDPDDAFFGDASRPPAEPDEPEPTTPEPTTAKQPAPTTAGRPRPRRVKRIAVD